MNRLEEQLPDVRLAKYSITRKSKEQWAELLKAGVGMPHESDNEAADQTRR